MSLSRRAAESALDESHHIALVADIIISSLFLVCFLWKLPRLLARLSQLSEWTQGIVIYNSGKHSPQIDDERTDNASSTEFSQPRRGEKRRAKIVYPRHVRSSNVDALHPVVAFLRRVISPAFSLGQLCVLTIYFGVLIYAGFYHSNPFTDPTRSGIVAVSQLPFVVLFATKNNIAGILLGAGYERLNYIHRFVGRAFIVAADLHSIYYIFKWAGAGTWKANIMSPSNAWGLVAVVLANIIALFSTTFWRSKAHNVFLMSHTIGFVILIPALWFHKSANRPHIIAALVIYGFSTVLRVIKTRITTATLRAIPSMESTRVEITGLTAGWRAGQHVRLRVLSIGMGWFGWSELHPFTIASLSGGEEGLVLICKQAGRWTEALYEGAKSGGYVDGTTGRRVAVMVEGPYGGPGFTSFSSFSAAVFVVGGSGITFGMAAIQELVNKDIYSASRVKLIELCWCVQDPDALTPLFPLFVNLIEQSTLAPLRISVYYTRAPAPGTSYSSATLGKFAHPRFTICPGRPRLGKVLEAVISRTVSLGSVKDSQRNCGVIVGVCGPLGMADDCIAEVALVDPRRRAAVGGIELYEEVFG